MQTIGFIAFGVVDLIVFSVVFTALIWAAVKDGQTQRTAQESALAAAPVAQPRVVARQARSARPAYKLAVAH